MISTGFMLLLDGPPRGQERARTVRNAGVVRTFTPAKTRLAHGEVRRAWEDAGRPRLDDGPIILRVVLGVTRPRGHFKRDGSLSAEGLRNPYPHRQKPDWDNAGKLISDALNGLAWKDDVQIVDGRVVRTWADHSFTKIDALVPDHEWIREAAAA